MNTRFYLFFLGLFLCVACDKNEENMQEEPVPSIEIEAYYESYGKQTPLMNAQVYVYNKITPLDLLGYAYDGKGNYKKDDHRIIPNEILSTDSEGRVIIYPQSPQDPISVFVENTLLGILSHSYWPSCQEKIKEKIIFTH